jgi:excisionase family DNA binding protein
MDSPLLKIPEVAKRLSVSTSFVYELIADGRLRHHRLGRGQGAIRVSEEQLQDYLHRTEHGGEVSPPPPRLREEVEFAFLPPPS